MFGWRMVTKDEEGKGTRKFGYVFAWLFNDPRGKTPEGHGSRKPEPKEPLALY